MNPLTNVKNIQKLNQRELEMGAIGKKSWHDEYKDSAWVFIGGLPYDLTEGDIVCVFSQYGEIVHLNLVRDKSTGKSKGFAFLCYEDQRSTVLAVDNLNSIKLLGRTVRVDHVAEYKQPKEHGDEDEVTVKLRAEGCAPTVPPAASTDPLAAVTNPTSHNEGIQSVVSEKHKKKKKKKSGDKKKNEKKKKGKRKKGDKAEGRAFSVSDASGDSAIEGTARSEGWSGSSPRHTFHHADRPVLIKREKHDSGYDRAVFGHNMDKAFDVHNAQRHVKTEPGDSHSYQRDRSRDRYRNSSHERDRDRSRERDRDRGRERDRDRGRETDRSCDRNRSHEGDRSHEIDRDLSRETDRDRSRERGTQWDRRRDDKRDRKGREEDRVTSHSSLKKNTDNSAYGDR